jgi:putative pyruvate formate lyase activating enzyme
MTLGLSKPDYCSYCPRECNAQRGNGNFGYCMTNSGFNISSICVHRGEEPAISGTHGICNIFFSSCNLQCVYCQNHQVSSNKGNAIGKEYTLDEVLDSICNLLDTGCKAVGFVSPSHCIPQVKAIIDGLHSRKYHPIFVYNSNGYDKVESVRSLEGMIDIYLPDFKYMDAEIAGLYSDAADYPEVAQAALKEMMRQKGPVLHYLDDEHASSGIIIRHLVLPGATQNSKKVLRFIAEECSVKLHISLMSQYYPTPAVASHPQLGRSITKAEYRAVTDEMEQLGFINGWLQDFESKRNYRPDFSKEHPFE